MPRWDRCTAVLVLIILLGTLAPVWTTTPPEYPIRHTPEAAAPPPARHHPTLAALRLQARPHGTYLHSTAALVSHSATATGAGTPAEALSLRGPSLVRTQQSPLVEPALVPALQALEQSSALGRYLAGEITRRGTRVAFDTLPARVHGAFIPARNTILVSHALRGEETRALATILAHEGSHNLDYWLGLPFESPLDCYDNEGRAFMRQSLIWSSFWGGPKPHPRTALETELNEILYIVIQHPVTFALILIERYGHRCAQIAVDQPPPPQPPTYIAAYGGQSPVPPLPIGARIEVWIELLNTGTATWTRGGAHPVLLGTARPEDRSSAFYTPGAWLSPNRAAALEQETVPPGGVGRFRLVLTAPTTPGRYREYFRPVAEGLTWFNDLGLYFEIEVTAGGTYEVAFIRQQFPQVMEAGSRGTAVIELRNVGTATWYRSGANPVRLATSHPQDRSSVFYTPGNWLSPNRAAALQQEAVAPGQVGRFVFTLTAPMAPGTYREYFQPVADGLTWFNDLGIYFEITVVAAAPRPSPTPTPTPPPTATPTPTPLPRPTATPTPACPGPVQAVVNPSFETGLAPWVVAAGFPMRTRLYAYDGAYSVLLGGYNNATEGLGQAITVPSWAEVVHLRFSWLMFSLEVVRADALSVAVGLLGTNQSLFSRTIWNTAPLGMWREEVHLDIIPDIRRYRGQTLALIVAAFTDNSYPTEWYVDRVELVFACR